MKFVLSIFIGILLSGCGGGGGGSGGGTGVLPSDVTLSGTVATGKAIAGATIAVKCQTGTGAGTSTADGAYSLVVVGGKLPCLVQGINPIDSSKIHTVATGSGNSAVANITPLTEMVTGRLLTVEPSVFFAAFDTSVAASKITELKVKAAQNDVAMVLTGTVDTTALVDFIGTPLHAATGSNPTGGDAQDKMLDALGSKISPQQLTQIVTALAHTINAADVKQVVTNMMSVPPAANAGPDQSAISGTVITLDGSASTAGPNRTLTFAWALTLKPTASTAVLSSSTAMKPTFTADVAGTYAASLVVNDGQVNSSADAINITVSAANAAPVANPGTTPSFVLVGQVVMLDGSASSDANGDTLTYAWTVTAKPASSTAILYSPNTVTPNIAPDVAGNYVVSLTVNDGKVNSTAKTVSINAVNNVPPVANAGPSQTVAPGAMIALDGTSSSDADGDPLTYSWVLDTKPSGSQAVLVSPTSSKPSFTTDVAGSYTVTLVVNDGKVNSALAWMGVSAGTAGITGQGDWQTTLQPRDINGDGVVDAYYDTVQNITWLADRNFLVNLSLPSLTWADAKTRVASLNVYGVTGWRLPEMKVISGQAITSEFSDLYFFRLGNVQMNWNNIGPFWFEKPFAWHNPPPPGWYWTGTANGNGSPWGFSHGLHDTIYFDANSKLAVWPVKTGDVR
ncbi:PKD domain-containing protein [Limnohabitans sp. Bal53]|uniref:PKD domain-containing protein n=1 Tax=Limnohabitans sp. Bal53 TaxID=1977910 RepID=UPI0011B21FB5|nr:PKD domain-containing protein [Limnohabitans sp. Bal53]